MFLVFCQAIVGVGVVAAIVKDEAGDSGQLGRSLGVVVAAGAISIAAQHFISPALDGTSTKNLASSYRARFFVRMALSEFVALGAFALGMAWGPWWLYYVGAAFTLIGFYRAAPTRTHLQADQDRLSLAGCDLSLMEALRTPTT